MPSDQTTLDSSLIGVGIQSITFSDWWMTENTGYVPVSFVTNEKMVLDPGRVRRSVRRKNRDFHYASAGAKIVRGRRAVLCAPEE